MYLLIFFRPRKYKSETYITLPEIDMADKKNDLYAESDKKL